MVLVDDLAVRHVELRRDDLVVSEEVVERAELLVVDHRRELRAVEDVSRLHCRGRPSSGTAAGPLAAPKATYRRPLISNTN